MILRVPNEGYSRNASCILSLISTFWLHLYIFSLTEKGLSEKVDQILKTAVGSVFLKKQQQQNQQKQTPLIWTIWDVFVEGKNNIKQLMNN